MKPAPRPAADLEQEATAAPLATVIEVLSSESLLTYEGHTLRATLPPNARQVAGMRSPLAVGDRVRPAPSPEPVEGLPQFVRSQQRVAMLAPFIQTDRFSL